MNYVSTIVHRIEMNGQVDALCVPGQIFVVMLQMSRTLDLCVQFNGTLVHEERGREADFSGALFSVSPVIKQAR